MLVRLAGEAPAVASSSSAGLAIVLALIPATAPILALLLGKLLDRWRPKASVPDSPDEAAEREGVLDPVREVPQWQYDKLMAEFNGLLSQIAGMEDLQRSKDKAHLSQLAAALDRAERAERVLHSLEERHDDELDRLRERLTAELARAQEREREQYGARVRAETLLAALQSSRQGFPPQIIEGGS